LTKGNKDGIIYTAFTEERTTIRVQLEEDMLFQNLKSSLTTVWASAIVIIALAATFFWFNAAFNAALQGGVAFVDFLEVCGASRSALEKTGLSVGIVPILGAVVIVILMAAAKSISAKTLTGALIRLGFVQVGAIVVFYYMTITDPDGMASRIAGIQEGIVAWLKTTDFPSTLQTLVLLAPTVAQQVLMMQIMVALIAVMIVLSLAFAMRRKFSAS